MLSHSRWCSPTLFRCIIPLSFANWSCFVWVLFAPPTQIDFFHCDLNGAIIRPLRPGEHDSCIKMPPFMLGSLNPLGQGMQNNGLQKNSIFGKYFPFFVSFCKSFCAGNYKCCLAVEEKNFEGKIKRKLQCTAGSITFLSTSSTSVTMRTPTANISHLINRLLFWLVCLFLLDHHDDRKPWRGRKEKERKKNLAREQYHAT